MNIFEKAVRNRYRFSSPQMELSVEDLWSLPLVTKSSNKASLDNVAQAVSAELNSNQVVSFVETSNNSKAVSDLQTKLDIVKYIIEDRKAHNEMDRKKRENQDMLQKLRAIRDQKTEQQLLDLSPEEIEAKIAELSA